MKPFEDYLVRSCVRAEWWEHSMDYGALKTVLKACRKRRRRAREILQRSSSVDGYVSARQWSSLLADSKMAVAAVEPGESVAHSGYALHRDTGDHDDTMDTLLDVQDALLQLATTERDEFSQCLQREWTKAIHFYETEILVHLRQLVHANAADDDAAAPESSTATSSSNTSAAAARELLDATAFLVVAVITLRQALIRYDGYTRTYHTSMPLTEWHWQRSLLAANDDNDHSTDYTATACSCHPSHYQQNSATAFPNSLHWNELRDLETVVAHRLMQQPQQAGQTADDLHQQFQLLQDLLDRTEGHVQKAVSGHIVFQDRLLGVARQYFLFGLQSYGLSMEPKLLMLRGRHLKKEIKAVAVWREQRDLPTTQKKGQSPSSRRSMWDQLEPSNILPLLLNLISCFLFMMNNYIIEPSSAYYANALGSSDALSGLLIGGAPLFALVSAVAYSYWTNYSYKAPIVFAGTLMVAGNLMYANAYSYTSMELCLLGRAVTGLGAPRVINRRYVADATPFALRTVASAAFALATALGAAMGPAIAILLDQCEFEFVLPLLGRQYFNGMTGPGFFMSLCWLIYTIAILLVFREPVRSGLDELKEREQSMKSVDDDYDDDDDNDDDEERTEVLSVMATFDNDEEDDDESKRTSAAVGTGSREKMLRHKPSLLCGCCQNLTRAVVLCMSLIFMKRIALESIVGSTSIITKNRYAWSIANVGTLHLVNGIIIIPVSAMSGWLSTYYEDRYLAVWCMSITMLGMMCLVDFSDLLVPNENDGYNEGHWLAVGPTRYIAGSLIAFSGIEACESYVASLMSKVVPSSLAVGTFNSGLLATLVGTVRTDS